MVGAQCPFYHQFVPTKTALISSSGWLWSTGLASMVGLVGTVVKAAARWLLVVLIWVGGDGEAPTTGEGEGVFSSLQGLPSRGADGSPGRHDECLEDIGQHRALSSYYMYKIHTIIKIEIHTYGLYADCKIRCERTSSGIFCTRRVSLHCAVVCALSGGACV